MSSDISEIVNVLLTENGVKVVYFALNWNNLQKGNTLLKYRYLKQYLNWFFVYARYVGHFSQIH